MENKTATVVATRLKLRSWRKLRRFFKVNGTIKRQLKDTPGLVNYRLKADFLRLRFSTVSIWENDRAVDAFVRSGAHRQGMAEFDDIAVRAESVFVRWETPVLREVTWKEAGTRVAEALGNVLQKPPEA